MQAPESYDAGGHALGTQLKELPLRAAFGQFTFHEDPPALLWQACNDCVTSSIISSVFLRNLPG